MNDLSEYNNTSLYEVADEYRREIQNLLDLDGEISDEFLRDNLDRISGRFEDKAINVASFIKNLESLASSIEEAEKRMTARRKSLENKSARLRGYLLSCMELMDHAKISCPLFKISIRSNPPSAVITDMSVIPNEYHILQEPKVSIDKVRIKEAIKRGEEVPGAHLVSMKSLSIK